MKQETLFTSDPHLGWKNALTKGNRPFSSVEEMDATIINNWNKKVALYGPNTIIYCLGDFCIGNHDTHSAYLARLMGIKILIPGNHDYTKMLKKVTGWHEIVGTLKKNERTFRTIKIGDDIVVLNHYKMSTWDRSHYGTLHLYGHSHGGWPGDSQSCDVGVDCWNFTPITLAEAKARMKTQPKRHELDHHQPESDEDE